MTRELRLWPGIAAVALQWTLWFGVPMIQRDAYIFGMMAALAFGLVFLVWWLFFSRLPHVERWGAFAIIALMLAAIPRILDASIATGMQSKMFNIYVVPLLCLTLVLWAAASRRLGRAARLATLAGAIFAGGGFLTLLRTEGIYGGAFPMIAWRWTPDPEQRLLARAPAPPPAPPVEVPRATQTPKTPSVAAWPGFRGPSRDSTVKGLRIRTDWASYPPVELWRRAIGPGWSSFAVGDGLVYTQEQRGEFEAVACYNAATGKPVWTHRDKARFWESNAGAGPRSTPALYNGRVYTFGATGILNALDALDGRVLWTRKAASDLAAKTPGWGFTSSPLVVDDTVIVAVSGRLAAYNAETGDQRWLGAKGGGSYSSPHLLRIGGVPQVVLLSGVGATAFSPADGKPLWKHAWEGSTILQPASATDGGILITTGDMMGGLGIRRLAISQGPSGWTVEQAWTSEGLKPYFNDFVVHKGHAFGFDGSILSCIDLQDGKRKWKGGRYGHGQMLLLADQDLLLVLSEEGEVALVAAAPAEFTEVARFKALDDKTWNHPVLVRDLLLVRNGREMAAFRVPTEKGPEQIR